jgi:hypothetical protein
MRMRVIGLLLFCIGLSATVSAQTVEMVFTPAVAEQAVALKAALKVDKANVTWFGALALVGASPARKKAYADGVARNTAVVVLGEDALKAVSEIEFSVPLIVVNAAGRCAAKGRVIRVFDAASAGAPAAAVPVGSPAAVSDALRAGGEIAVKGEIGPVVQARLVALK